MIGKIKKILIIKYTHMVLFFFLLSLFSCISLNNLKLKNSNNDNDNDTLSNLIKTITNELSSVSTLEFSNGEKLLITSFVDLNNLKKSSSFGRLLSERLMTSMGNRGYNIIELRSGANLFIIEKEGEMVLTRNNHEISDKIYGGAIIYGTYLVSKQNVFVTARIARASDFLILKSWSGEIMKTPFIESLLDDRLFEVDVYERIPKK